MLLRPMAAYHSIDLTSAVHMHTEYALQAAVKTDVDTYTASDKRTLELEGHRMMCCACPVGAGACMAATDANPRLCSSESLPSTTEALTNSR